MFTLHKEMKKVAGTTKESRKVKDLELNVGSL